MRACSGSHLAEGAAKLSLNVRNTTTRIGRILGVNHESVVNWIDAYHAALPAADWAVTKPETLEMDMLL